MNPMTEEYLAHHKYIERKPTGNSKRPWRYIYDKAKDYKDALSSKDEQKDLSEATKKVLGTKDTPVYKPDRSTPAYTGQAKKILGDKANKAAQGSKDPSNTKEAKDYFEYDAKVRKYENSKTVSGKVDAVKKVASTHHKQNLSYWKKKSSTGRDWLKKKFGI